MKSLILCLTLFVFIECKEIGPCTNPQDSNCGAVVEVGVYIESLCPWSKRFVNNQLFPTFNKLVNANPPIMTVNLVPFGVANITFMKNPAKSPRLNYSCQHNDTECDGNILHSCAIFKYDIQKSLSFINCMFNSSDWKSPWKSAAECSQKLGLDFTKLSECVNSSEGLAFQYFMAGQTQALEPKHKYVPWITINGKHTSEIQRLSSSNLLKYVCDSYTGSTKPNECDSP